MKHNYSEFFNAQTMMGPNCLLLADEMVQRCPGAFAGARVLDLGCGQGMTSLYLARDTQASQIFATDLWIAARDLYKNLLAWNIADRVIPIHADARDLPYADAFFDVMVSVDAYHYFGRDKGFFAEKIWPLIAPGGTVMIAIPGLREGVEPYPELMCEWAGEEVEFFRTLSFWKDNLCDGLQDLACVTVLESALSDQAWASWFASGHPYAAQDKAFFAKGLGQYVTFVELILKKK